MIPDLAWMLGLFRPSGKADGGAAGYRHVGRPERWLVGMTLTFSWALRGMDSLFSLPIVSPKSAASQGAVHWSIAWSNIRAGDSMNCWSVSLPSGCQRRSRKLLSLGNRLRFLVWHLNFCREVPDVEA